MPRPIVLVNKRPGAELAEGIAPGNRRYGVMLAYTPLHHLLLDFGFDALVATSGNLSDEPIAFTNEDALDRLAEIADAFLINDRDIYTRVDDSIVRTVPLGGAARAGADPARPRLHARAGRRPVRAAVGARRSGPS